MTQTTCQSRNSKRQRAKQEAARRTILISRSSEFLSRCSDPSKYIFTIQHPRTGLQAIAAYGAILAMSQDNIFLIEDTVKALAQRAFLQNYQGTWKKLQEFLEETITTKEFEEKMFLSFGPYDIYGNILPEIARQMSGIKAKPRDPNKNTFVKKAQRRRGYRDKGTLRSVEDKARCAANILIATVEGAHTRQDRRFEVKHPLLHKEAITEAEVNSLTTLSALEELYEVADQYLKGGDSYVCGQKLAWVSDQDKLRGSIRRIREITAAFIDDLKGRIEKHQQADLRTQSQESRT